MNVSQPDTMKLAIAAMALANDLINCCAYNGKFTAPMSDIRKWQKARQQAGRILTGNDATTPDVIDFMEDFGGIEGHKLCLNLVTR